MSHFDIAILGGGPAGSSCAIKLMESTGLSVLLLEAGDGSGPPVWETLSPGVNSILYDLGLKLDEQHPSCRQSTGVTSSWGGDGTLNHQNFMFSVVQHGWHVDRRYFDHLMREQARSKGVQVLENTKVVSARRNQAGGWSLGLESNGRRDEVDAGFVIEARGRRGKLPLKEGARRLVEDGLAVVMGYFEGHEHQKPFVDSIIQTVHGGWWYCGPGNGNHLAVGFFSDSDLIRQEGMDKPELWLQSIPKVEHISARTEKAIFQGRLNIRSAQSYILDTIWGENWLAIGDAAAAYDPLSSSGVHRALRYGILAGESLRKKFIGQADAMDLYAQTLSQEYKKYLQQKQVFYRMENRWANEEFWQRRQYHISLDPHTKLYASQGNPVGPIAIDDQVEYSEEEVQSICQNCLGGISAAELAGWIRSWERIQSDREIILAIQELIAKGILIRAGINSNDESVLH